MKKRTIKVYTLILIAGILFLFYWGGNRAMFIVKSGLSTFSEADSITLSVLTEDRIHDITLWHSAENGKCYFFLPAYADLKKMFFAYDKSCELRLQKRLYKPGEMMTDISLNVPYELSFLDKNSELFCAEVTFLQSEKLPAIYINTESGALEWVHSDKNNKENADIEIIDENGKSIYVGELKYIKGHGNQTWGFDKRPYQIKLMREEQLLGMDSGDKWLLLANRYDPSHLRNSLVHDYADAVGMPYTSQMKYVDLYINCEYMGNYQLVEKIDVGQGRVNINDLEEENEKVNEKEYIKKEKTGSGDAAIKGIIGMNNPADITGGYLLERNYGDKYSCRTSGFITESGEKFVVRIPGYASEEQVLYISETVQQVENAIYDPKGIDAKTGRHYTELIDVESFVKKYLIEEIMLNEANGATSSWFYKPEDKVDTALYAGPVWDYDKAIGRRGDYKNPHLLTKLCCYNKEATEWFYALYEKKEFRDSVKAHYKSLFLPELEKLINEKIDMYSDQIKTSMIMDQIRWSDTSDLPSYGENDFESDVDYLKQWLILRRDFLNKVWIDGEEVYLIRYQDDSQKIYPFISVFANERVEFLPEGEDMELDDGTIVPFKGWYNENLKKECKVGDYIMEDTMLIPMYE